jgi:hypothetical protein
MRRRKTKQTGLERTDFDDYIFQCFIQFLEDENNYIETEEGRKLRAGVDFELGDARNRNLNQVCNGLWKEVLRSHLHNYTYN